MEVEEDVKGEERRGDIQTAGYYYYFYPHSYQADAEAEAEGDLSLPAV